MPVRALLRPDPGGARAERRTIARRRLVLAVTVVALLAASADLAAGTLRGHRRHGVAAAASRSVHRAPGRPRPASAAATRARRPRGRTSAADRGIDRVLARSGFVTQGGGRRREIALTFDDGPGPYTPAVVRALRREHAPATFFTIGMMAKTFRAGLRAERHAGFAIGDHTEDHAALGTLRAAAQRREIVDQTARLARAHVPFPRLFRPPQGSFDRATFRVLRRERMLMVLWTVDTNDYLRPGIKAIVHSAVAGARPGAIILLHDAGGDRSQTVAAVPFIVHRLRERGYRLVTVPRLLADDPPRARQRLPEHLATG